VRQASDCIWLTAAGRKYSFNRHKAFISLAYRLGIEHGKVSMNPARLVPRRHEENGRIRWLTADEETQLRAIIASRYSTELPAFDLALQPARAVPSSTISQFGAESKGKKSM
jgi:hypothetical protein